ncbi:hypothetical protein O181_047316 [Austropuccinia psidii MF-1]|uniref:Uncharacterized protein n=1 Tax=Austropuccinia psidii MF-1 TaxID=1389203 RepID=A0A9Q3DNK7_9BASI|nr:hypothetical protein [Austropuccinia psidii MF-1]
MPVQHSPPARKTRSQARAQAALTPTPTAPLDRTPAVPQLRLSRTTFKGPGEDGAEGEENSVEEEGSDGTEGVPALVGASQCSEGPTLALSNQPVPHKFEPSLLAIMQQMTQIMTNLQAASSLKTSILSSFKTSSMKEPECFAWTHSFKVRIFIHSFCQSHM